METGEHNYSAPPSASTSTATQTSTSFNDISCDVQTVISENSFLKQTNNSLARINLKLRKSNERLKNHNYYLKRKCHELADKVTYLNQKLQSLQTKFELSDRVTASLHECNLLIISHGSHLTSPSLFVKKIAVTCEKVLSTELENNWLSKKYYFDFVQILICNSFVSLHSEMFRNLDCHSYELLKKIVACYVSIRFKSFAKKKNEELKKKRLRSKLSRMIIFSHQ